MVHINKPHIKNITQGKSAQMIIIIAIVIIINLIAVSFFSRLDITSDKRFSISDYSKKLVKNLDDKLTIKAYFSSDIPYPNNTLARDVKDKLEEFKAFANRYFQFEFVSPDDKEKFVKEARSYRIPEVQVNVVEKDQIQVKKVVMGLVFLYEDRSEVIPMVQNTENMEYEISSKINKLIKKKLPVVGFLQGHGEISFKDNLKNTKKQLEKNYELKPITLNNGKNELNDVSVLVIPGPKEKIPDYDKYLIDQFIMHGGKVIFLIGNVDADINTGQAKFYKNDMESWLKNYGFNVERNLVYDARASNIQVRQGPHIYLLRYPFVLNVGNFNKTNMIVKDINSMTLMFASSIDTSYAKKDSIKVIPLAMTSIHAGVQRGRLNISPFAKIPPEQYNKKNIPLAALFLGKFKSYFQGKDLPDSIDTSSFVVKNAKSRILVVGNADFIKDDYLGQGNALFIANSIDWMAQESGLIKIRSKNITARQLKEVSEGTKKIVKDIAILLPSILAIIIGFIAWRIKKLRYARIRRYI